MNQEQTNGDQIDQTKLDSSGLGMSVVLLSWLAFAIAIPIFFQRPPTPVPADADDKTFSAERAFVILDHLVGDGIPHPAGSAQNDVVRERIVSLLSDFGYEAEIQHTSHSIGSLAESKQAPDVKELPLENILARLPGKKPGQAILLAAHYDSAVQGPGASDNGVGMSALLEIARMLKSEGPFEHDIIFLLTDGEEFGLLGADRFVELHPWADEIECVVNLEARGTRGPSFMFETSEHSRWLIPVFNQSVRRPLTSSLFYEVYKALPNDTDFTVFKRSGMQGYNFAYIGNVNAYHTADDNIDNVSLGSLQHHGENMLGLARTLANLDFTKQPTGQVVYFDLLGWKVVYWPASWSVAFSLIAIALILITGFSGPRDPTQASTSKLAIYSGGFLVSFLAIVALAVVGYLIKVIFFFDGVFDQLWPEFPWPVPMTLYLIPLTASTAIAWLAFSRADPRATWTATWLLWGFLALLVSTTVNGISHLFLIPVLGAGLSGVVFRNAQSLVWPAASGAICCGFMWLPLEALFYDALGFTPLGVTLIVVRATIVCSTFFPLLINGNKKSLMWVTVILGTVTTIALPFCVLVVKL